MILYLMLVLIILYFVRSTKVLAALLALLVLGYAGFIAYQYDDARLWVGLGLATLLTLFLCLFLGRIHESIDRLRSKKG